MGRFELIHTFSKIRIVHSIRQYTDFTVVLITTTTKSVQTQQFILLFKTTCFGLKGHHEAEDKN